MLYFKFIFLCYIILFCQLLAAQGPVDTAPVYQIVSIAKPNVEQIHSLPDIGVDLTCGAIFREDYLHLALSEHTLHKLEANYIVYRVLVDYLTSYYIRLVN